MVNTGWSHQELENRIYFQEAHNTQFDFQLLINNYDNFMLSCIIMFDVPTMLNFMFVHVLISSVTAICNVGWLHHYNYYKYDGTDFVSVVTCVVVFLHYIIYSFTFYHVYKRCKLKTLDASCKHVICNVEYLII